MSGKSLRHHSAHPPSKVLANPNVNQKPNPAPVEQATAPAPRAVLDKPGAVANPNFPANPPKPLPVAQNNPSLGPIVSGRTKLDAVNSRLDEVDVCDPDSPDYDPDAAEDCEEEERQPRLKIS